MSCSVCAGYSSYDCPCCGHNAALRPCEDCEGTGMHYYAFNIHTRQMVRVKQLTYDILPVDEDAADDANQNWCQGDVEPCRSCNGEGMVRI